MSTVDSKISRMRDLMNYGLQTENKNTYSGVEHMKEAADGKTYGIVREGAKFYIKVADKSKDVVKEDFNYIGGFMNRRANEYESFAGALKNFDMKLRSINEARGGKSGLFESWNVDGREDLAIEATDKMKKEIARQRQIMGNVSLIEGKKNYSAVLTEGCCGVDKDCAATQKDNIKKEKGGVGDPKNQGGDPFSKKVKGEIASSQKNNQKNEYNATVNEEETLAWNDNKDYLDKSNGTEIGDSTPFTKAKGSQEDAKDGTVVEEETAMHDEGENQNSPEPGTNEIGDSQPFDKKVTEGIEDDDPILDGDGDEPLDDASIEDTDADEDINLDDDADELSMDADEMSGDEAVDAAVEETTEEKIDRLETLINKIADKLGVGTFDDDSLYDDNKDDSEEGDDDDEPIDAMSDDAKDKSPLPDEGEDDDDDEPEVYESRSYKKMMVKEEGTRLNDFGKHPGYRKKPMELPANTNNKKDGYYDMNDDAVEGEQPFGEKIGSSMPFELTPEDIANALAESIVRTLSENKKKH